MFFGYYPIIKSFAERTKNRYIEWIIKIIVSAAAISIIWFVFRNMLFSESVLKINSIIVIVAALVVLVIYDIGLSKLIAFYISAISSKRK